MILYLDTFISETALSPNKDLDFLLHQVQNNTNSYKKKSKIEILQYVLVSYSVLNWEKVILRVDGEDKKKVRSIENFIKELFPNANLEFERSDTGSKYSSVLNNFFKKDDNPWVFFSPNNDHPFIGNDSSIFNKLISDAEIAEKKYKYPVSIVYSHYTETINSIKKDNYLYGYTGDFCKIIAESNYSYTVQYNHLSLFSLQIYRSKYLYEMMEKAGKSRVIRTECLGPFVEYNQPSIVIVPKKELCRHYDGYLHTYSVVSDYIKSHYVPPLFIPDGFFEKKINIKFGYEDYFEGFLNINPNADKYIFEDKSGTDYACHKNEIPKFWLDRIAFFDENPNFQSDDNQILINRINNPWKSYSKFIIKIIIFYRQLFFSLKISLFHEMLKKTLKKCLKK